MPEPSVTYLDAPPPTADVVIVGGGIVGCATAFFAMRAGLHVVVLERRPALSTLTTPASTGAFRLQFDNPAEIALVREGSSCSTIFPSAPGWMAGRSVYTTAATCSAH
jgi:choline dehydrogenase-like flavoprotein